MIAYQTNSTYSVSHIVKLSVHKNEPDCSELLKESPDPSKVAAAEKWKASANYSTSDSQLRGEIKANCDRFLKSRKYFLDLEKTEEEKQISIAFSLVVFKSASQIERLLRTIYRPWNYYCFHVDKKSNKQFFEAVSELTRCLNDKYNNIVTTANRVDVQWGRFSVLEADLNCLRELLNMSSSWKYLINLTGQEFPLKTNAELAKILIAFKGANNLEGTYKHRNEDRVFTGKMSFPIVWYKGSVHVLINRQFVEFIFKSPKAKAMLNVLKNQGVPDEQFFSTLNYNTQFKIPGSYVGDPDEITDGYYMIRYKNWGSYTCKSNLWVRAICIWGVGDLPKLVKAPHLFVNKLYEEFQPAALRCLERWYYDKVHNEVISGKIQGNPSLYSSLSIVKSRYIPPSTS